jgi:hypothetical protein
VGLSPTRALRAALIGPEQVRPVVVGHRSRPEHRC